MKPDPFTRLRALRDDNEGHAALMAALRPRFAALANRHENGTAPRAVSAYQLFQTPPDLARRLVEAAEVRPGMRVLEPSAGLGRILDALPACEVVAVEMAPECAGELFRQDRQEVRILQRDFLTCTPDDLGLFDAVAMNPPFHLRSDIRHILHARQFLKPGGRLAALCMAGSHRERELRPLCTTWEPIPAGTFAKEGTRVETVLITTQS